MDELNQQPQISQAPQAPDQLNSSLKNPIGSKVIPFIMVAVLLILLGVGSYILGTKKSQPVVENKVIVQPSPTPIDETANWKTYINTQYGFEVKYPTDRRISETNNYTLPALNTNKDIVMAIQSTNQNYPRSLTGLNISANNNVNSCSALSNGQKVTETKNINGLAFLVYEENVPSDAMGGFRSLNNEYRVVHDKMCYTVQSSVFWTDISFVHDATDAKQPSAQELEEQQNWIQTQRQLNNQILSTFKFTDQSLTVDETANWKTYANNSGNYSFKYPNDYQIMENQKKSVDGVIVNTPNTTTMLSSVLPSLNTNMQIGILYENQAGDLSGAEVAKKFGLSINATPYIIDGKSGFIFADTPLGAYGSTIIYILANNKSYTFTIESHASYSQYKQYLDQILSTFRFAN